MDGVGSGDGARASARDSAKELDLRNEYELRDRDRVGAWLASGISSLSSLGTKL